MGRESQAERKLFSFMGEKGDNLNLGINVTI